MHGANVRESANMTVTYHGLDLSVRMHKENGMCVQLVCGAAAHMQHALAAHLIIEDFASIGAAWHGQLVCVRMHKCDFEFALVVGFL